MFTSILTNTPLRSVPDDYLPQGSARWYSIPEGPDAGKTMFYFDHGDERAEATVVFVHGNPECSYTYRHVRQSLSAAGAGVRMIAMDHIGFGLSDQATFEMVDIHHASNLVQLVRHLDLRDVTLVVHDWGGPIGIGALIDEHERVRNLVVMNTTIFPMPGDGLTYENFPVAWLPWCRTPALAPDALWGGVAARVVSHGEPQSTARFMAGVAGHFGSWDPCGKASVIRQWHEALPRMRERTHVYRNNGHFIEEYRGPEIARSILEMNGLSGRVSV